MFLKRQEVIEFNPANKAHRAAARAFLRRKAWVDCPLRFAHDTGYGSVAEQVQAKLLDWYVAQEEAKEAKNGSKSHLIVEMGKSLGLPVQDIRLAEMPTS
jgi:hypothetical protein